MGYEFYIAVIVGVTLSLLYAEITGVVPAGLVVPGYLALVIDQPVYLLIVVVLSLITYLVVTQGLAKLVIMYGRRQFAAMILVGIALKLTFDTFYPVLPLEPNLLLGVGVIIPGLIANTIQKQGVVHTFSSTALVAVLTYGALLTYNLL